ncbi:3-hydroxyacyl-CoA dehydrogenase family protein [Actinomadura scrupuli]|uniref:3-hydroxyacyl-CoA dehydrogenase family protein n=1 Tax=Actinomadura scrupuli TaxID=559629 RepID=UPI003D97C70B
MSAAPRHTLVVGGGTMGTGIAYVLALAGHPVTLVEPDGERAAAAVAAIGGAARKAAGRGRLDPAAAAELPARITVVPALEAAPPGPEVAVEAVPERAGLKRQVLSAMERLEPGLLATNTSGLPVTGLAGALDRPGRFLGLHFFNPVWSMPLVEIVVGEHTAAETVDAARALVAAFGKESIVVRDAPGFATSRLGVAIGLEAMRMLEEGVAEAADIDKAMELGYRHPMGPLRLTDLVGLDVRLDIARHLEGSLGPRFAPPAILVRLVGEGRLGKKTGHGFYEWE